MEKKKVVCTITEEITENHGFHTDICISHAAMIAEGLTHHEAKVVFNNQISYNNNMASSVGNINFEEDLIAIANDTFGDTSHLKIPTLPLQFTIEIEI